ncbi:hypothetical protein N7454_003854 [Penicillium verhagenii]|nr:hypothetical protein N7454_003854 [Penicillium verhagenii]
MAVVYWGTLFYLRNIEVTRDPALDDRCYLAYSIKLGTEDMRVYSGDVEKILKCFLETEF